MGDFNSPHIDWQTLLESEGELHRMLHLVENNCLSQMVREPTPVIIFLIFLILIFLISY